MEKVPPSPETWSTLRLRFARFAQGATWPLGYRVPDTWFQRSLIDFTYWFIYKGKGELTDLETGATYSMHPGVCVLMRPGQHFTAAQVGNEGLGNIYIHASLLRADQTPLALEAWPPCPLHTEVPDFDFFNIATRRLLTLLRRSREADYPAQKEALDAAESLFKGLILDLCHLHRLPKTSSTALYHQRAVEKALRVLDEQPQRFLSVEAWAATSGYSASHFRTLCLKYTGKSPMEHLIHARIRQAKEYLQSSLLTVGMIAHQLGYENTHYFSRQFRKQTGMTASEYRRRAANRLR
ncbi:MAG TPA: AraC family transcriptional regulator [Chthoniobacteraceae bacterium]|nr:AraC family transcriptional regulator [Chthoniobacteraceae bacterium]